MPKYPYEINNITDAAYRIRVGCRLEITYDDGSVVVGKVTEVWNYTESNAWEPYLKVRVALKYNSHFVFFSKRDFNSNGFTARVLTPAYTSSTLPEKRLKVGDLIEVEPGVLSADFSDQLLPNGTLYTLVRQSGVRPTRANSHFYIRIERLPEGY